MPVHILVPNAAAFLLMVGLIAAVTLGIWTLALVDVSRRSEEQLAATGLPRAAWIVLVLIAGPIGGLAYLILARTRLRVS